MIDKSSRILITGATGFLGSYILRLLVLKGYENITALKRKNSRMGMVEGLANKVNWVEADILDIAYLEKHFDNIDYVIHSAAYVSLDENKRQKLFKVNKTGTANIVNLCLSNKVKKIIHISSIAALGRDSKIDVIDESKEWIPNVLNSTYGESKYLSELEVWRGMAEGLDVLILNPSLIIGAGYWDDGAPAIIHKLAKGVPFYPKGTNGMVDVRDVAEAVVLALDDEIRNERIIITADNISYQYLFNEVSKLLGKTPPQKKLNNNLAKIYLIFDWLMSKLARRARNMTGRNLRVLNADSKYDNRKSIERLKLKYRPFDETLKDTTEAYKNTKGDFGLLPI